VSAPRKPEVAGTATETEGHGEIEITEEMIKAGIDALLDFDRRYESDEDAVQRIFIAMISAHLTR
jgi:hypothetical protein